MVRCKVRDRTSIMRRAAEGSADRRRPPDIRLMSRVWYPRASLSMTSWHSTTYDREMHMARRFKIGDHVSWNSEAGRVSGTIIKIHARDIQYKGYTHHATADAPQYEIKSDKTDHIALHKGTALTKLRR